MNVDKSAIIHPSAHLEEGVTVGPYSIIGANAVIGAGCEIASHVVIEPRTRLGKNCRVYQGASVGGDPQVVGFDRDIPSQVTVGDENTIREFVTIHRSTRENESTTVGNHSMLMAYSHVAHDCRIGNHVVVVNYSGISGHIEIEDHAFISGQVGLHQYVRIGRNAMVGGMSGVNQDVLPFSLVAGFRAELKGINAVGLRRSGFSPELRVKIKKAYKIIHDPQVNNREAADRIEGEIETCDAIRHLVNFMRNSKRGFIRR